MSNQTEPKLPKWPFSSATPSCWRWRVCLHAARQAALGGWQVLLVVLSGAAGAVLAVVPFVSNTGPRRGWWKAAARFTSRKSITSKMIAAQINAATARWQVVQEHSANSVAAAREIAAKMSIEAGAFREFLQRPMTAKIHSPPGGRECTARKRVAEVVVRSRPHLRLVSAAERSNQRTFDAR